MSFSGSVKQELVRQLPSARHCQIAELADTPWQEWKRIFGNTHRKLDSRPKILYVIK